MTVRTLAGLLPLFVSLIGFFIVLGIIFFFINAAAALALNQEFKAAAAEHQRLGCGKG